MFQEYSGRSFVKSVFTFFNVRIEPMAGVPAGGALAWEGGLPTLYVNSDADLTVLQEAMLQTAARLALGYHDVRVRSVAVAQLIDRHVTALASSMGVPEHLVIMAEVNGWSADRLARMAGVTERLADFALANRDLVYNGIGKIARRSTSFRQAVGRAPRREQVG